MSIDPPPEERMNLIHRFNFVLLKLQYKAFGPILNYSDKQNIENDRIP